MRASLCNGNRWPDKPPPPNLDENWWQHFPIPWRCLVLLLCSLTLFAGENSFRCSWKLMYIFLEWQPITLSHATYNAVYKHETDGIWTLNLLETHHDKFHRFSIETHPDSYITQALSWNTPRQSYFHTFNWNKPWQSYSQAFNWNTPQQSHFTGFPTVKQQQRDLLWLETWNPFHSVPITKITEIFNVQEFRGISKLLLTAVIVNLMREKSCC